MSRQFHGGPPPWQTGNLLAAGEETFPRASRFDSISAFSGNLRLMMFTARKTETTTQVRMLSGTTASAGLTLARIGLYTVAANGDCTLVAPTANDTTLFGVANTAYTRAWQAPFDRVAGQRYAIGVITVGTTAGSMQGLAGFGSENALPPRLSGQLTSQTDLPASVTEAALGSTGGALYAVLLP